MSNGKSARRPILVSFSGVDGAGKSTQIESLRAWIEARGHRTALLAFWDNVVVGTQYREGFVHKVYGSEKGVGAPGKPVNRRDKNVRKWYLTIARHSLYLADALNLRRVLAHARRTGCDVIIMDRYIYDELANLPLKNRATRAFIRFVSSMVPTPDVAYLLDADPDAAFKRKPEYPLDFMRKCRQAYFDLANLLGNLTVIPPLPLDDAKAAVLQAFANATQERANVTVVERNPATAA
jgi:thymidylate kinase